MLVVCANNCEKFVFYTQNVHVDQSAATMDTQEQRMNVVSLLNAIPNTIQTENIEEEEMSLDAYAKKLCENTDKFPSLQDVKDEMNALAAEFESSTSNSKKYKSQTKLTVMPIKFEKAGKRVGVDFDSIFAMRKEIGPFGDSVLVGTLWNQNFFVEQNNMIYVRACVARDYLNSGFVHKNGQIAAYEAPAKLSKLFVSIIQHMYPEEMDIEQVKFEKVHASFMINVLANKHKRGTQYTCHSCDHHASRCDSQIYVIIWNGKIRYGMLGKHAEEYYSNLISESKETF